MLNIHNPELLLRKYMDNFLVLEDYNELKNIENLNSDKILLVTDDNLVNLINIKRFLKIFKKYYDVKIFTLESSEPDYKMIESTSKKIFENNYNCIIALGGGSILDIVKASSMIENSLESVDNYAGSKKNYKNKSVRTIAIPTTAGTGSEFTHTSVYKTRDKIKNWLWDELTYFDYTIYIPSLTLELPKKMTIASGVDAFDHLIESLMSVKFNHDNIELCNKGMNIIWDSLPKLLSNKNNIADRKKMLLASGMAGKAIHFTGCGICHCIAHTLGSITKVPHGVAVAYGLLYTIEPVLKYKKDLIQRFDGSFKGLSCNSLINLVQDWIINLKIDYKLIEGKINFEEFIKIYFLDDNQSMRNNTFFQPKESDLKILLNNLWN